jgi:hypothetical protein
VFLTALEPLQSLFNKPSSSALATEEGGTRCSARAALWKCLLDAAWGELIDILSRGKAVPSIRFSSEQAGPKSSWHLLAEICREREAREAQLALKSEVDGGGEEGKEVEDGGGEGEGRGVEEEEERRVDFFIAFAGKALVCCNWGVGGGGVEALGDLPLEDIAGVLPFPWKRVCARVRAFCALNIMHTLASIAKVVEDASSSQDCGRNRGNRSLGR